MLQNHAEVAVAEAAEAEVAALRTTIQLWWLRLRAMNMMGNHHAEAAEEVGILQD